MPTYSVISANVQLSPEQEAEISAVITKAHHEHTGAPGFFAQTIFSPISEKRHYIGGKPNDTPHIFVHGMIRDGRSADVKAGLMTEIAEQICKIAAIGSEDIWVYLQDIPATQMIEFGRILPQPGSENEWRKGITPEKLETFAKAGVVV
jgi:phenylpyruvate tautomerase PptA (4-oxalocrotonate tautomerase family)